jgi:hypothetical protein
MTDQWDKRGRLASGKHAGSEWQDVPRDYLVWCAYSAKTGSELADGAQQELDRRGIAHDRRLWSGCDGHALLRAVNSLSVRAWHVYTTRRLDADEGLVDFLLRATAEVMPESLDDARLVLQWPRRDTTKRATIERVGSWPLLEIHVKVDEDDNGNARPNIVSVKRGVETQSKLVGSNER